MPQCTPSTTIIILFFRKKKKVISMVKPTHPNKQMELEVLLE
jgi:hypothetical protein